MAGYDGHLHEKDAKFIRKWLTILCSPVVGVNVLVGLWPVAEFFIGIILGGVMGWWATPDLDHTGMTREEYRAMKKFGILGSLWVALWTPYAFIFPHRSFWSHSVVGTAIRFLIVMTTLFLLFTITKSIFGLGVKWPWTVGYVGFFLGWYVQDAAHYVRDGLDPLGIKKWK